MYLPLLISTSKTRGAFSPDLEYNMPFDTLARFGLYIKHIPFTIFPEPKNIIEQEWKDENGMDVYIPENIVYKSYAMEVEFVYYRNDGLANVQIAAFCNAIIGRWLKIYDTYTKIGRQQIYAKEFENDPTFVRRGNHDYASFKVIFSVNDPNTNIKL